MSVEQSIVTKEEMAIVKKAALQISEHFSSVRIFVTKHDGEKDATGSYTQRYRQLLRPGRPGQRMGGDARGALPPVVH